MAISDTPSSPIGVRANFPPGSAIINTASVEAYQPKPSLLTYATTKGVIVACTMALVQEVIRQEIRANAVA